MREREESAEREVRGRQSRERRREKESFGLND